MRTIEVTLYKFDELPTEEAKKRALEWAREHRGFSEWDVQDLTDRMKEEIEEAGYYLGRYDSVCWSLSHCQGDGVCFSAEADLEKVAARLLPEARQALEWAANCDNATQAFVVGDERGHTIRLEWEDIQTSTAIEWLSSSEDKVAWVLMTPLLDRLREAVEEDIRSLQHMLQKMGYDYIEDMDSDENLVDAMDANGDEFDEEGNYQQ